MIIKTHTDFLRIQKRCKRLKDIQFEYLIKRNPDNLIGMFARYAAIRRLDTVIKFYSKQIRWYARKHLVSQEEKQFFIDNASEEEREYLIDE